MDPENIYEKIEAYLAGQLEGEALEQFEKAVQSDPALAEEVALYRDMSTALEPSEEDALRANLELLGKKHTDPESGKTPFFNWWIGAAIAMAGLGVWWWKTTPDQSPDLPVIEENSRPTEIPETIVPPETQDQEKTPPVAENESPENEREEPPQIAANFRPNAQLEALFDNQVRGEEYRFRVLEPTADANISDKAGKAMLLVSGILEASGDRVDAPFRVLLFSNKKGDYEHFKPILTRNLVFKKDSDGFRFSLNTQMSLPKGLYYYLIENEDSGMVYHIGRVYVD